MTISDVVKKQYSYFNSKECECKNIDFRIKQLCILESTIRKNESALSEAVYKDFKKSKTDVFFSELSLIYSEIRFAKKNLRKWANAKKVKTNPINFPAKSFIIPEPLGVSLIISAWNYPLMLSFAPVVSAISAGCTMILKPSEIAKNSSVAIAKIVRENFDAKYFSVIEGGVEETQELLNQKFDKIFFIGSKKVGRIIYESAAKNLTPLTLELGGKSPTFVTQNANLDICVKRLVWAKFLNAGQTCIAPDYVLIHKSVKEEFLNKLKSEIENVKYSIEQGNYVQVINDKNMQRLIALLDKEKVFFGGNYDIGTRYFSPTIMQKISFEDTVMQEEIFGPILPVIEYENLDEIIAKIKSLPKALACYVFSSDKKEQESILRELSFGGGCVNDALMHISNNTLPFGGVGESGFGSYRGEAGFKSFSHYKSILNKSTYFELPFKYMFRKRGNKKD